MRKGLRAKPAGHGRLTGRLGPRRARGHRTPITHAVPAVTPRWKRRLPWRLCSPVASVAGAGRGGEPREPPRSRIMGVPILAQAQGVAGDAAQPRLPLL